MNARLTCCSASHDDRCGEPVTSTQGSFLTSVAAEEASLINWARKRANRLAIHASRVAFAADQVIRFVRFPGNVSGHRRRQQQGGEQTGQGLESRNDSSRGGRGVEHQVRRQTFIPETSSEARDHHEAGSDTGRAAWPRGCRLPPGRPFPGGERVAGPGDADKRDPRSKDRGSARVPRAAVHSSEPR